MSGRKNIFLIGRPIQADSANDSVGFNEWFVHRRSRLRREEILSTYLGTDIASRVRVHLTKVGPGAADVALVDCRPSSTPVFLVDGNAKQFHVRFANTTRLMDVQEASAYIAEHWKGHG